MLFHSIFECLYFVHLIGSLLCCYQDWYRNVNLFHFCCIQTGVIRGKFSQCPYHHLQIPQLFRIPKPASNQSLPLLTTSSSKVFLVSIFLLLDVFFPSEYAISWTSYFCEIHLLHPLLFPSFVVYKENNNQQVTIICTKNLAFTHLVEIFYNHNLHWGWVHYMQTQ